jgi:uncharacterized protein
LSWFSAYLSLGPGVTPVVFAALCAVSFIGSLSTAMLGLGGGVLMLGVLAVVFPPTVVVPLHGAIQLGSNLGRSVIMLPQVLWSILPAFAVGSVLGAFAGANVVLSLPLWLLQLVLAAFLLYMVWGPRVRGGTASAWKFFLLGSLGTFAAMFVGTTGPLMAPFVAAASPERQRVVATQGALMSFQHGLKILAFGVSGFAFAPYATLLVAMLGFGLAGTFVGSRLLLRLPEERFRLGFRIIMSLLALRLAWSAVVG